MKKRHVKIGLRVDSPQAAEVNRRFAAMSRGERVSPLPLSAFKRGAAATAAPLRAYKRRPHDVSTSCILLL